MEDLTKEFIAESLEGLDRMERCLTTLEVRPDDPELVAEIFRAVHSIKGTTGFLGFGRLEALAHAGESLLGMVRDGQVPITDDLITVLLALLDGLRRILALIDETGGEGKRESDDDGALIEMLRGLMERKAAPAHRGKWLDEDRWNTVAVGQQANEAGANAGSAKGPEERVDRGPMAARGTGEAAEGATYSGAEGGGNERTLRVDVDVLNRMMNLVGELVLTRNQILQSSLDAQGFAQLGRRLNNVTTELRETVMQARMQPVGNVFGKFPRLVRDLAKTCGKMVRIEFSGQETGLDKSLLEAIKDPLTHAVRNAVDHGIESPSERVKAGKAVEGVMRLRAFHQGGTVVIELSDDGGGIAVERVRAKAIERKLVSRERAEAMADQDVVQMVFLPGFSTAEAVTNVSGRGVGMDVVRSNVEKAGGSVELETRPGQGTTLRLRVPLTLAIIPALVVVSGGQSFALPQSALVELVYVGLDEVGTAVERMGDAELYRLRDRLLPMVRLDRLLQLEAQRDEAKGFYLAVLEADGCRFGLVLDDLLAPEEIVVKPLSLVLREIGIFSGATVLGNGTLALILDVGATAARAGVSGVAEEITKGHTANGVAEETSGQRFLIFAGKGLLEGNLSARREEKVALPLEQVERIESVALRAVEYVGGRPVLQYRGEALPLEDGGALGGHGVDEDQMVTVLICTRTDSLGGRRRRVGLVVGDVSHVTTGTLLAENGNAFGGQLALVEGRVTRVKDVFAADGDYGDVLREVA